MEGYRTQEIVCWECHGSGVVACDQRPVPCPVCGDEYGRLKVVPASQLVGAVEALREAADYLRHDEPDAAAVVIERACEVLGVDPSTNRGRSEGSAASPRQRLSEEENHG